MTEPEISPAQLRVSLSVLARNYQELKRRSGAAECAPVVKADAYGVGLEPVARHLAGLGAGSFFVARAFEGAALRRVLHESRIFVFDGLGQGGVELCISHRLIPVLNTRAEVRVWCEEARRRKTKAQAALQIDTGMNRSGIPCDELAVFSGEARGAFDSLDLVLIMSHLACADAPEHAQNRKQLARFRTALAMLPPAPASLAATSGIDLGREFLFDLTRPGVGLYGGNPNPAKPNPYAMAVRLTAPVLQIRNLQPGECVGYGATFTADGPVRVAIVAAGYADGLIRALGPRGHAMLAGQRVRFAGRISMDLCALNVTSIAPGRLHEGMEAEFLGPELTLDEQASAAGTVHHEVLTSITQRTRRVYVSGEAD